MSDFEKVKPVILHDEDDGISYTLEFTRESVKFAEQRGFDINDVSRFPMTKLPELFFYAFRAHHKNVSRDKTDKILFEKMGGIPDGLIERLGQLYAVPFMALTDEEGEAKNSRVTVEL